MVKECLKELHHKVLELKNKEDHNCGSNHIFPLIESILDDTIRIFEDDLSAMESENPSKSIVDQMLSDSNGSPGAQSQNHEQQVLYQPVTDSLCEPVKNSTIEDKVKVLAEQLSVQALVTVEMATLLEKYEDEKSLNNPSTCTKVLEALQELSTKDPKSSNHSIVLGHVDTLAEKLLVQSQFMQELLKLQNIHRRERAQPSPRTSRESESCVSFRSNPLYEAMREKSDKDQIAALLLTHVHISYILHVYNDRILHLSKEAKDANIKTIYYQSKLREIIQACKTQDVEQVSMLAVEIDTGGAPTQEEELCSWNQHIDYGSLHGAQANFVRVDLSNEAAFFRKLAEEVSCMSTDVRSLVDLGVKLVDINGSLSQILNPSVVGENARTIAYEAISQAELVFICQRLRSDYEEEVLKLNSIIQKQSEYCSQLKDKLNELEEKDSAKVDDLRHEHKLKVENFMAQLEEVEKARKVMTVEMDVNLTRLSKKQLEEMEILENKHKQEILSLQEKLKFMETKLEKAYHDNASEVEKLKNLYAETKKQHE